MPQSPRQKLQSLLYELFQFDSADLDFGIYRIMNLRRDELRRFIDKDLLDAVAKGFEAIKQGESHEILEELADLRNQITQSLGSEAVDAAGNIQAAFRNTPLAKQYGEKKAQLADVKVSEELEAELFSDIYTFFSRYWDDGDFISRRRYSREAKYAIPYNGEEVMLHWANHDQYYIKSGEHFNDYTVKADKHSVCFKVVTAQTEQNNVKGEKRFFLLDDSPNTVTLSEVPPVSGGTQSKCITILFQYRPLTEQEQITYSKQKQQDKINDAVCQKILNRVTDLQLKTLLSVVKDGEEKSLLAKHLYRYTKKNTTDYFIHKDLKGFLERELDFYIKNEVMMLDAIGTEKEVQFGKYLTKVKVLKQVCLKIIAFLAQLEDFQKKLFEKRKFVLETNYCMTLDNVQEEFYDEILENEDQLNAWKELFALPIDAKKRLLLPQEVKEQKPTMRSKGREQQSLGLKSEAEKLNKTWLKKNLRLVLDTKFFDPGFTDRLLANMENLGQQVGGLLIESENFQALNLLQKQYSEKVNCIYVDPPYNTDASAILYKNDYKDSSWLALIENRLRLAKPLLANDGIICVAIDDEEASRLRFILQTIFHKEVGIAVVRSNPAGRKTRGTFAPAHEYAMFYGKSEESVPMSLDVTEARLARYPKKDAKGNFAWANFIRSGSNDRREDRPKLYYPIFVNDSDEIRIPQMKWDEDSRSYALLEKPKKGEEVVYPVVEQGNVFIEKNWQRGHERVPDELDEYRVRRTPEISIDFKTRMDEDSLPNTWWDDKEYASANYGASELKELFGEKVFDFAKARKLVEDCILASGGRETSAVILDFFAGSATTGHAVINLNRGDKEQGKRSYVLVEVGEYFETVVKPRIQRSVYSKEWKEGKPVDKEGISHIFKYQTLESYEDTLNNIVLQTNAQEAMFEDYTLRYMLDYDSRASASLLNVEKMSKPFDYELDVYEKGERKRKKVDLMETFNYLLGLEVNRIRAYNKEQVYRVVFGTVESKATVVVWRNTDGLDLEADKQFIEKEILKDEVVDTLYINGDSFVPNAHPIEKTFKERMFAPVNV